MNQTVEPTSDSQPGENRLFNIGLAVLFVSLVVVAGLLIRQNRDLKATIASLQAAAGGQDVPRLEPGDVVEPFSLPALDGSTATTATRAMRKPTSWRIWE